MEFHEENIEGNDCEVNDGETSKLHFSPFKNPFNWIAPKMMSRLLILKARVAELADAPDLGSKKPVLKHFVPGRVKPA